MGERTWVEVQQSTFVNWCNTHLVTRQLHCNSIEELSDGVLLCNLASIVMNCSLTFNAKPKLRLQKLENASALLSALQKDGLKLVGMGPEDIVDGRVKLLLGLIWTIILRYHIKSNKAELLAWVKQKLSSSREDISINNFTTDWQDGNALRILVNRFVDEKVERKSTPLETVTEAMNVAEKLMKIPIIYSPNDLVISYDELSMLTYIAYFYHKTDVKSSSTENSGDNIAKDMPSEEVEKEIKKLQELFDMSFIGEQEFKTRKQELEARRK